MRIVSQNGIYDLPYDKCFVWIHNEEIFLQPIGEPDSDYILASYSTPEKAEQAIQLLHQVYVVHENFKKMDAELQLQMLGCANAETRLKYGGIFQFPKEEDLP